MALDKIDETRITADHILRNPGSLVNGLDDYKIGMYVPDTNANAVKASKLLDRTIEAESTLAGVADVNNKSTPEKKLKIMKEDRALIKESIDAREENINFALTQKEAAIKAKYLGKKGLLTEQLKSLSQLPIEERKAAGAKLNIIKQEIEELLKTKQAQLNKIDIDAKLQQTSIDVTLPGRRVGTGGLHPVSRTLERVEAFFKQYGFISADGPEIEDD